MLLDQYDLTMFTRTDEAIAHSVPPLHELTRKELQDLLVDETVVVKMSVEDQVLAAFADANTAAGDAAAAAKELEKDLEQTQRELAATPKPQLLRGLVATVCVLIGVPAEAMLNWMILPWALDVPRTSPMGVALSVAPTMASFALELVLHPLFKTEEAWDQRPQTGSRLGAWGRRIWINAPLVAVLYLAIMCPMLVAKLRGVATMVQHSRGNIRQSVVNLRPQVDEVMVYLAISLVVITAVMYIFAATQARRGWIRRSLRRKESRLLARWPAIAAARRQTKTQLWAASQALSRATKVAEAIGRLFAQERKVKIAQLDERRGSAVNEVNHILRLANRR